MKKLLFINLVLLNYLLIASDIPQKLPSTAKELEGNYIDEKHQNIRFGAWSIDLVPFRAWNDTVSTNIVPNAYAVCTTLKEVNDPELIEKVMKILSLTGFKSIRLEIGMGAYDFDTPKISKPERLNNITWQLQAAKKYGIRPLILLNSNSGSPFPNRKISIVLAKDADVGAKEVFIADTSAIKPLRTGFRGQAKMLAYPLITKVHPDGRCELSAPLLKPLKSGAMNVWEMKYTVFTPGKQFADGTPNPSAEENVNAWVDYAKTTCTLVRDILGTEGEKDVGFDVEVWNEYSFGSEHMQERYFEPKREFKDLLSVSLNGQTQTGREVILPLTVMMLQDPKNGFPGVRVTSGFAGQRPWDNGEDMWTGQYALSKHYYSNVSQFLWKPHKPTQASVDVFGVEHKNKHYIPTIVKGMPERTLLSFKTEMLVRDLQPFPSPFPKHFRYSLNPIGDYPRIWETEYNISRREWAKEILKQANVDRENPKFQNFMEEIGSKNILRAVTMLPHKGVDKIFFFALGLTPSKHAIDTLSLAPDSLKAELEKINLDDEQKLFTAAGKQIQLFQRLKKFMDSSENIKTPRRIEVGKIVEHKPLLLVKGDGSKEHPDKFARDYIAILPFQRSSNEYAVAIYIPTLNAVEMWDKKYDILDSKRYELPTQWFDVELKNIRTKDVNFSLYNILHDRTEEVKIVSSTPNSAIFRVPLSDYPKFLVLEESQTGPLIIDPKLDNDLFSFVSNVDGEATITWGKYPQRTGAGEKKLAVKANKTNSIKMDNFKVNYGVKVTLKSDNLETSYPQWNYDPQGAILSNFKLDRGNITISDEADKLIFPKLPPVTISKYNISNNFKKQYKHFETNNLDSFYPALISSDSAVITEIKLKNIPAWQLDIALDAASHPGEKLLYRRYVIVPLDKKYLILEFSREYNAFERFKKRFLDQCNAITFVTK